MSSKADLRKSTERSSRSREVRKSVDPKEFTFEKPGPNNAMPKTYKDLAAQLRSPMPSNTSTSKQMISSKSGQIP
jgi:hypothetical protein